MNTTDPFASRGPKYTVIILVVGIALSFVMGYVMHGGFSSPPMTDTAATTQPGQKQLWTCGMHPQVIQDHPGNCPICHMELTPLKAVSSDAGVTIDPVIVQNMGVRVVPVVYGSVQNSVRVVGYLQEPEALHRDINLRVRGWIEKLYADTDGMAIEKGKPLFDLYSPDMQVAMNELITARKSLDAVTDPTAKQTAQMLYSSTARKLELWGLEHQQVEDLAKLDKAPETVPILAPTSGHLTEKKVYEGGGVEAGMLVMRIANRHLMWVDAQVFEQQLPLVKVGSKAKVNLVAEPGKTIEGEVIFIHPHLNPQTRTATVRVQIDNADHRLREGMYATLDLLGEPSLPAPVIPREAIIDTGTRQITFVAMGEGRFEPRELKLGLSGNGLVQVLSGVSPNEQVVVSGQFLLDSESRLKEAIQKHLSENLASAKLPADTHDHGPMPPMTTVTPAPALNIPHTDEMAAEYLKISQALGANQQSDDPIGVDALLNAAQMAAMHATGEGQTLAGNVAKATEAMKGKSLTDQRRAFLDVSNAMITLLDRSSPSATVAKEVYVFHCPMAFSVQNANWLQTVKDTANPYYATQMKNCGDVQRTIAARSQP